MLAICAVLLFAEFLARWGLYNYELYKSYQLTKNYYGQARDFDAFKNEYERISRLFTGGGVHFVNDRYNRRYYSPELAKNRFGFMQKEPALEKRPGVTRIMCIGTSTVEMGFPKPLQEELDRRYPGRYEVINAGIPGSAMLNNFMNYSLVWHKLKPDIVVLEHNIDDVRSNGIMPFEISADYENREKRYLDDESLRDDPSLPALYRLTCRVISSEFGEDKRMKKPSSEGLERYETVLNAFVDLVKGSGATPVLMTYQPALSDGDARGKFSEGYFADIITFYRRLFPQFTIEGAMATVDAHNEITRKTAQEKKLLLADTVGLIPRMDKFYKDGTHLGEKGSKIAAGKLINVLEKSGLIGNGQAESANATEKYGSAIVTEPEP